MFGGVFCLLLGVCLVITKIRGIEVRCRCECNSLCFGFSLFFPLLLCYTIFMFRTLVGMGFLQGDVLGVQTSLLGYIT